MEGSGLGDRGEMLIGGLVFSSIRLWGSWAPGAFFFVGKSGEGEKVMRRLPSGRPNLREAQWNGVFPEFSQCRMRLFGR